MKLSSPFMHVSTILSYKVFLTFSFCQSHKLQNWSLNAVGFVNVQSVYVNFQCRKQISVLLFHITLEQMFLTNDRLPIYISDSSIHHVRQFSSYSRLFLCLPNAIYLTNHALLTWQVWKKHLLLERDRNYPQEHENLIT